MWIAFIFQYLWDITQQSGSSSASSFSCELLSFFNIFGILHNVWKQSNNTDPVVNCFHFSISLGYYTTVASRCSQARLLWIAFIFQYLWDITQLIFRVHFHFVRCELLSFFNIFGILHNLSPPVVPLVTLWIAFIFQYLWDITQRQGRHVSLVLGCELLSFFNIFGILHNLIRFSKWSVAVVNCFHFSISLGYYTTSPALRCHCK